MSIQVFERRGGCEERCPRVVERTGLWMIDGTILVKGAPRHRSHMVWENSVGEHKITCNSSPPCPNQDKTGDRGQEPQLGRAVRDLTRKRPKLFDAVCKASNFDFLEQSGCLPRGLDGPTDGRLAACGTVHTRVFAEQTTERIDHGPLHHNSRRTRTTVARRRAFLTVPRDPE